MVTPNQKEKSLSDSSVRVTSSLFKRFDRMSWLIIVVLGIVLGIVYWQSTPEKIKVTEFSWSQKRIGANDHSFTFHFNRWVDGDQLSKNIVITPSLVGNFSGQGKSLSYTLNETPVYGRRYSIQYIPTNNKLAIEPFNYTVQTRNRYYLYISTDQKQQGRLMLTEFSLQGQKKSIPLTPPDIAVTQFAIYPDGETVLFSAYDPTDSQGFNHQQLYTVTTGLNFDSTIPPQRLGRINPILEGNQYQNSTFKMSDNGQSIVVQRSNRNNPADSGLWLIQNNTIRPLGIVSNQFTLSPDGNYLAISQDKDVALISLHPSYQSQLLPGYQRLVNWSKDGSKKILIKANYTGNQSLYLIGNEGLEIPLANITGEIKTCELEPHWQKTVYCVKTETKQIGFQSFQETALIAININTNQVTPLLGLPNESDIQMNLSADGIALLFDQRATRPADGENLPLTEDNKSIAAGRIWLLLLSDGQTEIPVNFLQPQELVSGFKPLWIP